MSTTFQDDYKLTPEKLIEDLSFQSATPESPVRSSSYVPLGPPPAAAPPPPSPTPPSSPMKTPENGRKKGLDSYQHGPPLSDATNRELPSYQQQERFNASSSSTSVFQSTGSVLRGDASIRPNTGESNSAEGDGTALHEVMWRIRWINITVSTLTVFLQSFALFSLQSLAHFVLGGYLIFFALTLCCFEIRPAPIVSEIIRDYFGMLYHPTSRVVFLILLAMLCWGQGGAIQVLLGMVLLGNAFYTLFVYMTYPEYRRIHMERAPDNVGFMRRYLRKRHGSQPRWANPDTSTIAEGQSLLV